MNGEASWQPVRAQALSWREWDEEFVVYNEDTGSTHHLNALGGEVLLALLQHPDGIGEATLVREVEARFERGDNVAFRAEVGHALSRLSDLEIAIQRDD